MLDNYIWYEKYRPRSLEDMILSKSNRRILAKYLKDKDIPHLLFYGTQGSGKTTTALIIIKELKAVKLILNASSEDRGIDTIKGKVKQFASSQSESIKIVFLDEADYLTPSAQPALRNTIETYSKTCRFILTANEVDRIIPALQSRCILLEFSTFPKDKVYELVSNILTKEEVKWKQTDIRSVIERYYPDIRSIINIIQSCSVKGRLSIKELPYVTLDLKEFDRLLIKGELGKLREKWAGSIDFTWLYKHLFNEFIPSLSEKYSKQKAEMAMEVATYMYQDSLVVDKEINFAGCCISLMQLMGIKRIEF